MSIHSRTKRAGGQREKKLNYQALSATRQGTSFPKNHHMCAQHADSLERKTEKLVNVKTKAVYKKGTVITRRN